jgi:hypothetical protein
MTTLSRRLRPARVAQRTHASSGISWADEATTPRVPARPLPEAALAPLAGGERRLGPATVAELGVGEAVPL